MQIDRVASTVILYHPKEDELVKNIESFIDFVDILYLVDNSEDDKANFLDELEKKYDKIKYIQNRANLGIAKALNIACSLAKDDGYKWILTMDQDSVFMSFDNFLECCRDILSKESDIAIFAPNHNHQPKKSSGCEYISKDIVITSGNLLNLEIWSSVGGFDSDLFIDMVDYDISFKVVSSGKKIAFLSNQYLKHSLGKIYRRKNLITKKIKEKIEHNPQRVYYKTRNSLYLATRHRQMGFLKTLNILFIHEITKIALYEDLKMQKLYAKFLALFHFLIGKKGRYDI